MGNSGEDLGFTWTYVWLIYCGLVYDSYPEDSTVIIQSCIPPVLGDQVNSGLIIGNSVEDLGLHGLMYDSYPEDSTDCSLGIMSSLTGNILTVSKYINKRNCNTNYVHFDWLSSGTFLNQISLDVLGDIVMTLEKLYQTANLSKYYPFLRQNTTYGNKQETFFSYLLIVEVNRKTTTAEPGVHITTKGRHF